MQVYQGKSVYEGIAIGRIQIYQKKQQQVKPYYVADVAGERSRFEAAVNEVANQLTKLHEKEKAELGESDAAIFEMHLLLLKDADYLGFIDKVIQTQMVNAEYAVAAAAEHFTASFSSMDGEYMRERAADVRDASDHLLAVLTSRSKAMPASMGRVGDALKEDLEPVVIRTLDIGADKQWS